MPTRPRHGFGEAPRPRPAPSEAAQLLLLFYLANKTGTLEKGLGREELGRLVIDCLQEIQLDLGEREYTTQLEVPVEFIAKESHTAIMSARVYDQVETAEESIHSHLNDRELVALLLDRLQYDSGAADYYRARYDELNNRFEDRIYLLENSLRESQNDQLSMRWLISLGYMGSSSTAAQAIPVRVFTKQTLSIRVQQQLQSAIEALLEKFGFDVSLDLPGEFGSFWKRLWAKASGVVSQKEVVDRLKKIERSIETHHIDKPQAEANKANAESFSMIMNSLGNVDDACIQIGNILIVKHTPRGDVDSGGKLLVRTLSIQEMIALEEDQSLLKDPASILRRLQSVTVSRNEADTSRPMLSEVDKDTGT